MSTGRNLHFTAYSLPLPDDGTHEAVVLYARAAGLPWSRVDAARAVELAAEDESAAAALAYTIDMSPDPLVSFPRVSYRLMSCARLVRDGQGEVPAYGRAQLVRLRDICRELALAADELLDASE